MKKVLQFSGLISLVLAAVAFILMLATHAIQYPGIGSTVTIPGTYAIFGHQAEGMLDVTWKLSAMELIAWILALAGMVIILLGVLLPLFKVNALQKFAGLLNLIAVCCLVLAGVFMFFVIPTFFGANDMNTPNDAVMGAGWVIGAILFIVAGAFAILPAAMDFLGKKK